MTGRRLYEHFCEAAAFVGCYQWVRNKTALPHPDRPPVAWAFLPGRDREVWNEAARRVTPRRKAARS